MGTVPRPWRPPLRIESRVVLAENCAGCGAATWVESGSVCAYCGGRRGVMRVVPANVQIHVDPSMVTALSPAEVGRAVAGFLDQAQRLRRR